MEQVLITIDTENDAFEDAPASEVARILRAAADRIEQEGDGDFPLMDINGNTVGAVKIK